MQAWNVLEDAWAQKRTVAEQLVLMDCGISANGAKALASGLAGNSVLKSINLANNRLCGVWLIDGVQRGTYDPSGIQALAAAIGSGSGVLANLK